MLEKIEYYRKYRDKHRLRLRVYNRLWMRKYRNEIPKDVKVDPLWLEIGQLKRKGLNSKQVSDKLCCPLELVNSIYFKV